MGTRRTSELPTTFAKFIVVLAFAALSSACGRSDNAAATAAPSDPAAEAASSAPASAGDEAEEPAKATHHYRLRVTHRVARHRHAGPR